MLKHPISLDFQWGGYDEVVDKVPSKIYERLIEQGSLTALLKSQSNSFKVKVIDEQYLMLPPNIAKVLENEVEQAVCRQVLLYCDDQPHVYAQSWILLGANEQGLTNLGEQPLGEKLFQQSLWHRGELEVSYVDDRHSHMQLCDLLGAQHGPIFARRSVFTKGSAKVLVCEIFNNEIK
ncbi:chorismate--pyruvate lyase family protein [Pseudoalteromonas umbrosa]|uniref:chorismate--pyruvate lyase family protein n=1 Tax=Pseudoalteromonas umbrosa TaxID=3048489 RepID=UPI0024C32010|nr:chorismate lyase [Pseudoalteromonas sp. B95]MDK1289244.1 chorismate lyase [Pseudoalteromonas sp. B95]